MAQNKILNEEVSQLHECIHILHQQQDKNDVLVLLWCCYYGAVTMRLLLWCCYYEVVTMVLLLWCCYYGAVTMVLLL